ncbi:MAG: dephospho-CoA kinase, partial [Rectinemataceae bacterium]|nr:dephospho-CoA kinase [Rectinemataceae bacterium]
EGILHPLVRQKEAKFIESAKAEEKKVAVLEIPLLFETGAEKRCAAVAVVTAPCWIQKRRVMARPGMTEEKFQQILSRQMPDGQKRRRAHYVIYTGWGKALSAWQIGRIYREIL